MMTNDHILHADVFVMYYNARWRDQLGEEKGEEGEREACISVSIGLAGRKETLDEGKGYMCNVWRLEAPQREILHVIL